MLQICVRVVKALIMYCSIVLYSFDITYLYVITRLMCVVYKVFQRCLHKYCVNRVVGICKLTLLLPFLNPLE